MQQYANAGLYMAPEVQYKLDYCLWCQLRDKRMAWILWELNVPNLEALICFLVMATLAVQPHCLSQSVSVCFFGSVFIEPVCNQRTDHRPWRSRAGVEPCSLPLIPLCHPQRSPALDPRAHQKDPPSLPPFSHPALRHPGVAWHSFPQAAT